MSVINGRKKWFLVAGIVLAAGVSASLWLWTTSAKLAADPGDPEQVALGRVVYAENCASCHGEDLEGQPDWRVRKPNDRLPAPPHNDAGHTWHHSDDVLFGITKQGISGFSLPDYESDMPAFKDVLSDEEIWAVLSFIMSNWSDRIQQLNSVRNGREDH